jgi:RNA-directed DNA polymerase
MPSALTRALTGVSASAASTREIKLGDQWYEIPWRKLEDHVKRLQQRIYRAEGLGQKRRVRGLQRVLMRSQAALLLAIRQVTQINKGKRTAGVDGYKATTPAERVKLYQKLKGYNLFSHNPKPTRRSYIPKDKKRTKLRPLGIPVMNDRVYQHIAKLALEPQWEYHFESISYGFRPKRGCHDAIEAIWNKVNGGSKKQWIFEGDFRGCFDNLKHDFIMDKIKDFPAKDLVLKWLKAGVVDNNVFQRTDTGTPQGGIISPLLANIALHGMEVELGVKYRTSNKKRDGIVHEVVGSKAVVRYADDFVIICDTKDEAESMYEKLKPYLAKRGLELAPEKTRVVHISEGFDFLGFSIRSHYTRKTNPGKWKTLVKPSNKGVAKAIDKIRESFKMCRGTNVKFLIKKLNPIIRGYANYWCTVVSKNIFDKMDNYIWKKTKKFLKQLHPKKSWKWIKKRYFKPDIYGQSGNNWLLTSVDGKAQLIRMAWKQIKRHTMVKYKNSPFDSDMEDYYLKRSIKVFERESVESRQKMAKTQKYQCPLCGSSITDGNEGLEIHHKTPKCHGGTNEYKNLWLVHISCHTEHHKWFPAKGPIPKAKEILAHRRILYGKRVYLPTLNEEGTEI